MSLGAATGLLAREQEPVLRAVKLSKSFPATVRGGAGLPLFRDLDFSVGAGEMVAIIGRSGTGKSSLLHLLAGLERPSSGEVWLGPTALGSTEPQRLAELRNRALGYVWQFHYLLPEFTALENVAMPLLARGMRRRDADGAALRWLERVGLEARASHRSGELSGGEQQRVAFARALVTGPQVLLADEPTGDLDDETAAQLFGLLETVCREEKLAVVLVTHNGEIAQRCDRTMRLTEGRLVDGAGDARLAAQERAGQG